MSTDYAQSLLSRFPTKPVLLDSNLLLLLLLGSFDVRLLRSFKRLSGFTVSDLAIVKQLAGTFSLCATPHVLTEISNLANALPESLKLVVYPYMASALASIEEIFLPAAGLVTRPEFRIFGLTDTALCALAQTRLIITEDRRFAAYLRSTQELAVLTLDDLRALRLHQLNSF